eukprot:TRINITY_DN6405_c0_g1_i2.p1 TRINITY_DN6405_c0_g1~~TRINITY_DN6405_c0_g1_i2.p1  ORF type:complete len:197 (-),score=41.05 TRINITY_DN6405_c0_g1_i2:157-747(-)
MCIRDSSNGIQAITPCRNRCRSSLAMSILPPASLFLDLTAQVASVKCGTNTRPFNGLLQGKSISKFPSAAKRRPSKQRSRNEGKMACESFLFPAKWKTCCEKPASPKQSELLSRYEQELLSTYTSMIGEAKKVERENSKGMRVSKTKALKSNKANTVLLKYKKVVSIKPQEKIYKYQAAFPFRVTKIILRPKNKAS